MDVLQSFLYLFRGTLKYPSLPIEQGDNFASQQKFVQTASITQSYQRGEAVNEIQRKQRLKELEIQLEENRLCEEARNARELQHAKEERDQFVYKLLVIKGYIRFACVP